MHHASQLQIKPAQGGVRSHWIETIAKLGSSLHIILALFFVELPLFLSCGILILLVLGDEVVHIAFSFREFHFIHTFTGVPVQKGFAAEHRSEILCNTLAHFLDCCCISKECHCHLQSFGRDVTDSCLDVFGDPLNEIGRILVLDIEQLLVNLFCRHATSEQRPCCEISPMPRVSGAHHVLGIEHLLGESH